MPEVKPKIYLLCEPYDWGEHHDVIGMALAQDGTGLCSHLSSNIERSKHDMGLTSNWHHDSYDKHYPDGYELVWVDNPDNDEGFQKAVVLNKEKVDAS